MNQNFLEDRSNEKLNDLISEGLISQEFYRSGAKKLSLFRLDIKFFILTIIAPLIFYV